MSWYKIANPITPLARNITQWLMQARNGFSAEQYGTMSDDIRSLVGPMDDIAFAINEATAFIEANGGMTHQQRDLAMHLQTLYTGGGGMDAGVGTGIEAK
jgi:hypothetical protein